MDNKQFEAKIRSLRSQIDILLKNRLIALVQKALNDNPKLDHFVIAMGTYFFVSNEKNSSGNSIHYDAEEISKELDDFIVKYDDNQVRLSGIGLAIFRTHVLTDW